MEDIKKKISVCHKRCPVCGATLTAINDTVTQTGQEEGRSAISSARNHLSRSAEYSGMAGWQRANGVSCAEIDRKRAMWRGQERRMSLRSHHDVQRRPIRSESYTRPEPPGKIMLINHKWKMMLHFPSCSCQNKYHQDQLFL